MARREFKTGDLAAWARHGEPAFGTLIYRSARDWEVHWHADYPVSTPCGFMPPFTLEALREWKKMAKELLQDKKTVV
jgi:hypothetical protein